MAEVPLRQTAADMATVLRSVLAPVLANNLELRAIDELAAALILARAGMAMSRYQPRWLRSLDSACAKMQKPLKKNHRAEVRHSALNPKKTPKQLRSASVKIQQRAAESKKSARQQWLAWLGGRAGQACKIKLEEALLEGQKSKSFILADTQIDECLSRDEEQFNKCSQKLLNRSRWRNIKAVGKAAQHQRLSRKFVNLLGLQMNADERLPELEDYQSIVAARRTARWLKQQLQQIESSPMEAAACGALWEQQFDEAQRRELSMLVRVGALPTAAPLLPDRERPSLPLHLHFGNTVPG